MEKQKKAMSADVEAQARKLLSEFEAFSEVLSNPLTRKALPVAQAFIHKTSKIANTIEKNIKSQVKTLLEEAGEVFSDSGSKRLTIGKYTLKMIATGGGYDEEKIHALLKGKGIKKSEYTEEVTTYTINHDKIHELIGAKKLKKSELEDCRRPQQYAVHAPDEESNDE